MVTVSEPTRGSSEAEQEAIRNELFTPTALALLLLTEANEGWLPPASSYPWPAYQHFRMAEKLISEGMIDDDQHRLTDLGQAYCDQILQTKPTS